MRKEWLGEYEGHTIRVVNTWFSGSKLYIDGDCRDTNTQFLNLSFSRPALSASVQGHNGERHLIEVFFRSLFTVRAKICVNGRQVGGDVF
jgi:hypothetical protein